MLGIAIKLLKIPVADTLGINYPKAAVTFKTLVQEGLVYLKSYFFDFY